MARLAPPAPSNCGFPEPVALDRIWGRNPIIEALSRRKRAVRRIWLDEGAKLDEKVIRLVNLAGAQGVPVQRVGRRALDSMTNGDVHNGVVADAEPLVEHSIKSLFAELNARTNTPFLVLADELSYEQNLGAILRSSLGAGVDAVVVPVRRSVACSPVVGRVSMGGIEEVPVVREGISAALAACQREGLRVVGADMDGRPFWEVDLTGPLALVLGGESKGLTPTLRKRCDALVSVPLAGGLESLNVSVTAGVLMFERVRQLALR